MGALDRQQNARGTTDAALVWDEAGKNHSTKSLAGAKCRSRSERRGDNRGMCSDDEKWNLWRGGTGLPIQFPRVGGSSLRVVLPRFPCVCTDYRQASVVTRSDYEQLAQRGRCDVKRVSACTGNLVLNTGRQPGSLQYSQCGPKRYRCTLSHLRSYRVTRLMLAHGPSIPMHSQRPS